MQNASKRILRQVSAEDDQLLFALKTENTTSLVVLDQRALSSPCNKREVKQCDQRNVELTPDLLLPFT